MRLGARTLVAIFSLMVGVAACGGDDAQCQPGTMSMPNGAGDPCSQTSAACVAMSGKGVAMCNTDSSWGQCMCIATPSVIGTPSGAAGTTGATPAGSCGNKLLETSAGEQCEQGMVSTSCEALLGKGATGLVMCSASCKYDMSMCMAGKPTGAGGSGAMPVGGSGAMTGAGGSGR